MRSSIVPSDEVRCALLEESPALLSNVAEPRDGMLVAELLPVDECTWDKEGRRN
jgi:hypothetical protein